jgi:tape measure domain-containing protein
MSFDLGQLSISLGLNTGTFWRDVDRAEARMRQLGTKRYHVMVSVDDHRLTDLNAHFALKKKDHKELQQYFDNHPLTPRVNLDELEKAKLEIKRLTEFVDLIPKNIEVQVSKREEFSSSGFGVDNQATKNSIFVDPDAPVRVTGDKQQIDVRPQSFQNLDRQLQRIYAQIQGASNAHLQLGRQQLTLLTQLLTATNLQTTAVQHPNTIRGQLRKGFVEQFGKSAATGASQGFEEIFGFNEESLFHGVGRGTGKVTKVAGKFGKDIINTKPIEDLGNNLKQSLVDALDKAFHDIPKANNKAEKAWEILKDAAKNFGINVADFSQNIVAAEGVISNSLTETIKRRREAMVEVAAELAKDLTAEQKIKDVTGKKGVIIAAAGTYNLGGRGGAPLARSIQKVVGKDYVVDYINNTATDIPKGLDDSKAFQHFYHTVIKRLNHAGIKGYNDDEVKIAAKALAYRQDDPDIPIELLGHSEGGRNAEGGAKLLHFLGVKGVTSTGLATPNLGIEFSNNPYHQNLLGKTDEARQAASDVLGKNQSPLESALQNIPNTSPFGDLTNHMVASYLANPEVTKLLPKSLSDSFKNLAKIIEHNIEGIDIESSILELFESLAEYVGDIQIEASNLSADEVNQKLEELGRLLRLLDSIKAHPDVRVDPKAVNRIESGAFRATQILKADNPDINYDKLSPDARGRLETLDRSGRQRRDSISFLVNGLSRKQLEKLAKDFDIAVDNLSKNEIATQLIDNAGDLGEILEQAIMKLVRGVKIEPDVLEGLVGNKAKTANELKQLTNPQLIELAKNLGLSKKDVLDPKGKLNKTGIVGSILSKRELSDIQAQIDRATGSTNKFNESLEETRNIIDRLESTVGSIEISPVVSVNAIDELEGKIASISETLKTSLEQTEDLKIGSNISELIDSLYDLEDRIDVIKDKFGLTGKAVAKDIKDMEATAAKEGYNIQKDLSEGSPGTTQRIRYYWQLTRKDVQKQYVEIARSAKEAGTDIEQAFSAHNIDFTSLSADIREGLKELELPDLNYIADNFKDLSQIKDFGEMSQVVEKRPLPNEARNYPLDELFFDPKKFQYKLHQTNKEGATGSIAANTFNPDLAGVVQVWTDPEDSKTYVINGHNRASFAKSKGVKEILVRFIEAKDAKEARAKGALTNIAEGAGTAIDAAKFFRDSNINDPKQLAKYGIGLKTSVASQGLALAKLPDDLLEAVIQNQLPVERGALIGGSGLDHKKMVELYKEIQRYKKINNETIQELIDNFKASGVHQETLFSLFGETQEEKSLAITQASLQAHVKKNLVEDKTDYNLKPRRAKKLQDAGNVIDTEDASKRAETARSFTVIFDRLKNAEGRVNILLKDAAAKVAAGEDKGKVQDELYAKLIPLLAEIAKNPNANNKAIDKAAEKVKKEKKTDQNNQTKEVNNKEIEALKVASQNTLSEILDEMKRDFPDKKLSEIAKKTGDTWEKTTDGILRQFEIIAAAAKVKGREIQDYIVKQTPKIEPVDNVENPRVKPQPPKNEKQKATDNDNQKTEVKDLIAAFKKLKEIIPGQEIASRFLKVAGAAEQVIKALSKDPKIKETIGESLKFIDGKAAKTIDGVVSLGGQLRKLGRIPEVRALGLGIAAAGFATLGFAAGWTIVGRGINAAKNELFDFNRNFQSALERNRLKIIVSLSTTDGKSVSSLIEDAKRVSNQNGVNTNTLIESRAGFGLALQSSQSIETTTRQVDSLSASLGAVTDGQQRFSLALEALKQTASKGIVSSEEIRQQLSEHLPNVLPVAAEAYNQSTGEFINNVSQGNVLASEFQPRFTKTLEIKTSLAVAQKRESVASDLVRAQNSLEEVRIALGDSALNLLQPFIKLVPLLDDGVVPAMQTFKGLIVLSTVAMLGFGAKATFALTKTQTGMALLNATAKATAFTLGKIGTGLAGFGGLTLASIAISELIDSFKGVEEVRGQFEEFDTNIKQIGVNIQNVIDLIDELNGKKIETDLPDVDNPNRPEYYTDDPQAIKERTQRLRLRRDKLVREFQTTGDRDKLNEARDVFEQEQRQKSTDPFRFIGEHFTVGRANDDLKDLQEQFNNLQSIGSSDILTNSIRDRQDKITELQAQRGKLLFAPVQDIDAITKVNEEITKLEESYISLTTGVKESYSQLENEAAKTLSGLEEAYKKHASPALGELIGKVRSAKEEIGQAGIAAKTEIDELTRTDTTFSLGVTNNQTSNLLSDKNLEKSLRDRRIALEKAAAGEFATERVKQVRLTKLEQEGLQERINLLRGQVGGYNSGLDKLTQRDRNTLETILGTSIDKADIDAVTRAKSQIELGDKRATPVSNDVKVAVDEIEKRINKETELGQLTESLAQSFSATEFAIKDFKFNLEDLTLQGLQLDNQALRFNLDRQLKLDPKLNEDLFNLFQEIDTQTRGNADSLRNTKRSLEDFLISIEDYTYSLEDAVFNLQRQTREIQTNIAKTQLSTGNAFFDAAGIQNTITEFFDRINNIVSQASDLTLSDRRPELRNELKRSDRDYQRNQRDFQRRKEDINVAFTNSSADSSQTVARLKREIEVLEKQGPIDANDLQAQALSLEQQYRDYNRQVLESRQIGREYDIPVNLTQKDFAPIDLTNTEENQAVITDSLIARKQDLIKGYEDRSKAEADAIRKGLARVTEAEKEAAMAQSELRQENLKQQELEGQRFLAETEKLAKTLEGTWLTLSRNFQFAAPSIQLETDRLSLGNEDLFTSILGTQPDNAYRSGAKKAEIQLNERSLQLGQQQSNLQSFLGNANQFTTPDEIIRQIDSIPGFDTNLKADIVSKLKDAKTQEQIKDILGAYQDQLGQIGIQLDDLNKNRDKIIDRAGNLAVKRQELDRDDLILGNQRDLGEAYKASGNLDIFNSNKLDRFLGQQDIEQDYKRRLLGLESLKTATGEVTAEYIEAKKVLDQLKEIKLDNLIEQTNVWGQTLTSSVIAGFDTFTQTLVNDLGDWDKLWKETLASMLKVFADFAANIAKQQLSSWLTDLIPQKKSGGGWINLVASAIGAGVGGGFGGGAGAAGKAGASGIAKALANFSDGGEVTASPPIPNMAAGGLLMAIDDAYRRERAAGNKPVLLVAGEGERILTQKQAREWDVWQSTGVSPNPIPNMATGGIVGRINSAVNNYRSNTNSDYSSSDTYNFNFGGDRSSRDPLGRSEERIAAQVAERVRRSKRGQT